MVWFNPRDLEEARRSQCCPFHVRSLGASCPGCMGFTHSNETSFSSQENWSLNMTCPFLSQTGRSGKWEDTMAPCHLLCGRRTGLWCQDAGKSHPLREGSGAPSSPCPPSKRGRIHCLPGERGLHDRQVGPHASDLKTKFLKKFQKVILGLDVRVAGILFC